MIEKIKKWIEEHKRQIIIGLAAFILVVGLIAYNRHKSAELKDLTAAYQTNLESLKVLDEKIEFLENELSRKQVEISQLQADNDRKVKELANNAYKEAHNLSDNDLSGAFDSFISGARRRNEERERSISKQ